MNVLDFAIDDKCFYVVDSFGDAYCYDVRKGIKGVKMNQVGKVKHVYGGLDYCLMVNR